MYAVVVPLALLFIIVLVKPIPVIGGSVKAALLLAGLATALLSGMRPLEYLEGTVDGVDRMAWVIALSVFGAIYAETQLRLGTIDTTMSVLRRLFGDSPRGLIAATFITLVIGGSLLGDAIAAATVIGFLVIHALAQMKLQPAQIGMIILVGASLGSIMPPVSQAVLLSASLVETDPSPVIRITFATVTVGLILAILESFRFVRGRRSMDTTLEPAAPIGTTLRTRGLTLIPMGVLLVIVVLNSGWEVDVFAALPGVSQVVEAMREVPVLQGVAFPIVLAIIAAIGVTFMFPAVRQAPGATVADGLRKVSQTVQIQLCAAFLIGMFYASGAVDAVADLAEGQRGGSVTTVGILGIVVVGMLTGSQTAAQTIVVPFFAPILQTMGIDPTNIALSVSHIAAGSQNLPPIGLTAFVVAGLIGGSLNQKVDPVKVMILALPNSLYMILIGVVALAL